MDNPFITLRSRRLRIASVVAALTIAASSCSSSSVPSFSASPSPVDTRPINIVTIPSEALGDNLLGEPAERDVTIYLPPQYFTSEASFPVVYYLAGHGTGRAITNVAVPRDLDLTFETVDPMIVVIIDGYNLLQGSFYVDSSTSGGWTTFIADDVVDYVDDHYRTIPERESRGITGHSMGGFGAWDIAMRQSDVFGSVYMLAPGLFDENGLVESQWFTSEVRVRAMIALVDEAAVLGPEAGIDHLVASQLTFDIGYGMAFAPSDDFPYFEYPYSLVGDTLVRDDEVWALWESGFGNTETEVAEFGDELASLTGIGIDCGSTDEYAWIPKGCVFLDAELTEAGIDHVYATHTGNHNGRNRERVREYMLPFFADVFEGVAG
ncbi:MAG: alpha/beta hydrolase-fold protein [Demequinaceae bacterium]|nr:alpha/beta hydrolase-fold protein [Demequinaceae bacterium]